MNQDKFGLSLQTIQSLNNVFKKNIHIKNVIIYGSRAKGNYKLGSDIDLTLDAPNLNLTDLLKIQNEIDDLLLPYKVDLSFFHLLDSTDLIDHIKRVGSEFKG